MLATYSNCKYIAIVTFSKEVVLIKYFGFIVFFMFSLKQGALAQTGLRYFSDATITEMVKEVDKDSIRGWETHRVMDEVMVKVYTVDGDVFEFHCEESCHKEGEHHTESTHSHNPEITLEFIEQGREAAFAKLKKTLQRKKELDIGALVSYKVWIHEETEPGHDQGLNVWTKMVHERRTVFVNCHAVKGETELECHYRTSPASEHGDDEEHEGHGDEHNHKH